jgi:hypothetical protein
MATCVAEGIDPSRMCKTLMDKVADSEQLSSTADPGLLILFEDWLERLEEEIIELSRREGLTGASSVSRKLGLPKRTCELLIDRLKMKGKLG